MAQRWDQAGNYLRVEACIVQNNRLNLFVEAYKLTEAVNELHWVIDCFFFFSDFTAARLQRLLSSSNIILHQRHHF